MNDSSLPENQKPVKLCAVCGKPLNQDNDKYCDLACYKARPMHTKHRFFKTWNNMIQRCYNPNSTGYENYGGRGVTVCEEWRHDCHTFLKWADSQPWKPGMTLDRIDNSRGYSPENCRFATRKQQQRNQRVNRWVTAFGETKLAIDWAADPRCSVTVLPLLQRIKNGMSPEAAITTPAQPKHLNTSVLSDEEAIAAYNRVASGESGTKVAASLGVHKHIINRIVSGKSYTHLGLKPLPSDRHRVSDAIRQEMIKALIAGESGACIARRYGMERHYVNHLVRAIENGASPASPFSKR